MLTAALQGLAVHVTPSLPATVQYTTGGHPEWQTNFTEVLSRLWQPRSPDGDVLTVFVEVRHRFLCGPPRFSRFAVDTFGCARNTRRAGARSVGVLFTLCSELLACF